MELILLQKVRNLGDLGDKVRVRPGYGRNFLIPQGKAVRVNAANLAEFEAKRTEYEARAKNMLSEAIERQTKLAEVTVSIEAHAGPEGKLFGSVGPRDIALALQALGHHIHKGEVVMGDGPIRNTGEHDVTIHLHADVQAQVKVIVTAEKK